MAENKDKKPSAASMLLIHQKAGVVIDTNRIESPITHSFFVDKLTNYSPVSQWTVIQYFDDGSTKSVTGKDAVMCFHGFMFDNLYGEPNV